MDLLRNNPYFSRDIAEFWRRWHISCLLGFEIIYIFRLEVKALNETSAMYFYFFVVSGFGMALIGLIWLGVH
jgi:D-alanyl-lipoteichoic acid acyltransferase DltB (MBOAT superfamily)